MNKSELKTLEQELKELLLFDSKWKEKNKYKRFSKDEIHRVGIYRDLIKNSFSSVLGNMYEVTKKLLGSSWDSTVRKYVEKYPPSSPVLIDIGRDLPKYLKEDKKIINKTPFIAEVAEYEWLELEVYNYGDIDKKDDTSLNSTGRICSFEYPIPKIVNYLKNNPYKNFNKEATNLILYRDPDTHLIRVFELTTGTKVYLELLLNDFEEEEIKEAMIEAFKIQDSSKFEKEFKEIKSKLIEEKILI